jgi:hypothetical protein
MSDDRTEQILECGLPLLDWFILYNQAEARCDDIISLEYEAGKTVVFSLIHGRGNRFVNDDKGKATVSDAYLSVVFQHVKFEIKFDLVSSFSIQEMGEGYYEIKGERGGVLPYKRWVKIESMTGYTARINASWEEITNATMMMRLLLT